MKIRIVSFLLVLLLCMTMAVSVSATEEELFLLYDEADLLSDREEAELIEKLTDVSEKYEAQIVVITMSYTNEDDMDEYVEYIYDSMGFGYGEDHDGVLLLVCMDPREYRILSNGFAADAIDPDAVGSQIKPDLSDGNYADAFDTYVDQCEYYLDGHINGFPFDVGGSLMTALVIGVVVGVIVAFILKGQLKSVRKQDRANVYVKAGSMNVTRRNDLFLYRDLRRVKKETNKSSGSGSGSSRRVGGGSF